MLKAIELKKKNIQRFEKHKINMEIMNEQEKISMANRQKKQKKFRLKADKTNSENLEFQKYQQNAKNDKIKACLDYKMKT